MKRQGKITFDLDTLQEDSFGILKGLKDRELIMAFIFLDGLFSKSVQNNLEDLTEKRQEEPLDHNTNLKDYQLHLEASAKSKNIIKDYSREIERLLVYLKKNKINFSSINTGLINWTKDWGKGKFAPSREISNQFLEEINKLKLI